VQLATLEAPVTLEPVKSTDPVGVSGSLEVSVTVEVHSTAPSRVNLHVTEVCVGSGTGEYTAVIVVSWVIEMVLVLSVLPVSSQWEKA
jgi:hypothetical protein